MKNFLVIKNGAVYEYNHNAQKVKTFYTKGDAVRADWMENESVQVQLKDGKIVLINRNCQIYKYI